MYLTTLHIVGNKLDLLLTNWPEVIDNVSTFHPREGLFPSDHYAVEFMIKLKFKRVMGVKRQVYDFKKGNFDDLRDSLSRVPFEIAASAVINKFWDNWKTLFRSKQFATPTLRLGLTANCATEFAKNRLP